MKKVLAALLVLIVVVGAGGFFYVTSLDWNKHKEIIAQQFFEATGKRIVFAGPISFEIFPSPYLQAENVKIVNVDGFDKPLVEAKKLVAKLDLKQLLHKQFDVKQMELNDPQVNFELLSDGRLNWQSDLSFEQKQNIENANFVLNSVRLNNATFNYEDPQRDIFLKWDNLNGEVIAQSINGPFRLEGNYIKDNNPQGVAISIGKLSDTMDTTLNMVMTHPVSESYVRFDGSFMFKNRVINGNLILEAKNLHDFVAANISNLDLDEAYDKPLALSTDISFNDKQLNLANMVIKYGETQGAGNLRMPLVNKEKDGDINPRMEVAFDFTDLDLTPIVEFIKEKIQFYAKEGNEFKPDFNFDLLADLSAMRTVYNGQPVKNFKFSADLIENILTINELSAVVPGDTFINVKGVLSAYEGEPFYDLETTGNSTDFLHTLNWLGLEPKVVAVSTYKKAAAKAKITGNLKKMHFSPFSVTVDKSSLSGEAGIVLGAKKELVLSLDTDMINFDNYIEALPNELLQKSWQERMKYRFAKLGWLNDVDIQAIIKMNLALYGGVPFEKVYFEAELLNGKMNIENLSIASVINAQFDLSGNVSGFGKEPIFEDFNYKVETKNLEAFLNKIDAKMPNWNFKEIGNMTLIGALNGNLNHIATQTKINAGAFNVDYLGQVKKTENQYDFAGELELKHSDFVKMLKELNVEYEPQNNMLGLFTLKTKFMGNVTQFKAEELKANIGFNSFIGQISYDKSDKDVPNVIADLDINKFEVEKFLSKKEASAISVSSANKEQVPFLSNPRWSKNKINLEGIKKVSLAADLKIKDLSFGKHIFSNAEAQLSIFDGNANLAGFKSDWLGGRLDANLNLEGVNSTLTGNLKMQNIDTNMLKALGKVYGISQGDFNADMNINANVESEAVFIQTLKTNVNFKFVNAILKGFNFVAIYDDIIKRDSSAGLAKIVEENLVSGTFPITNLEGKVDIADGVFILQNVQIQGNGLGIKVQGEGNLVDWTMNTKFDVKYNQPKYLPGFYFELKGGMDNPSLEVNVDDLFNMYKSGEQKREAAVKAAEEDKQKLLKNVASEIKNTAEILLAEVQSGLEKEVLKAHENASNSVSANVYAEILTDINKVTATLVQNTLKADGENIDENILEELKVLNEKQKIKIETIQETLLRVKQDEEKNKTKLLYGEMLDIYEKASLSAIEYKKIKDEMYARLAKIVTDFVPKDDANITGWEYFIEDKIAMFGVKDNPIVSDYNNVLNSDNLTEISGYNDKIKEFKDDLNSDMQSVKQSIVEYAEYMNRKVSGLEDLYAKNLRDQEVQRKLEQAKGSISVKKSGKTFAVNRDIEDIEKAEDLVEDKELKVLDFSSPKKEEIEQPKSTEKNVIKKGRVKIN